MIEVKLINEYDSFKLKTCHFDLELNFQFTTMMEFVVEPKLEIFLIVFKERSSVGFVEEWAFAPIPFDLQSIVLLSFRVAFTFKDYLV